MVESYKQGKIGLPKFSYDKNDDDNSKTPSLKNSAEYSDSWYPFEKNMYKYNEHIYLKEISDYIEKTYSQHYSQNKFQATEFIIDSGHGTGFCIGNVLKYAQRYGRKGSRDEWRKDLMKVIHYAIMQLHVHDIEGTK